MGLPTRTFGTTGWQLTTIGLGTWAFGGGDWAYGWGAQDDAVIVYSPIHSGLLSGSFDPARLALGDWRLAEPDFTTHLAANLGVAAAITEVAERHSTTPSSVAVAWALRWPGVTGAIVGARNPRQIDGWLHASELLLDDDDLTIIASAISATGAGGGPPHPADHSRAPRPAGGCGGSTFAPNLTRA